MGAKQLETTTATTAQLKEVGTCARGSFARLQALYQTLTSWRQRIRGPSADAAPNTPYILRSSALRARTKAACALGLDSTLYASWTRLTTTLLRPPSLNRGVLCVSFLSHSAVLRPRVITVVEGSS